MWDGIERRQFPRARYPCLITLRKETSPPISILTHTENISVGGVRVIIGRRIKVATEVDLELDLKDALSNVASRGTVSWVKEIPPAEKGKLPRYDTGIQFATLKQEDRQRIATIVYRFKR